MRDDEDSVMEHAVEETKQNIKQLTVSVMNIMNEWSQIIGCLW